MYGVFHEHQSVPAKFNGQSSLLTLQALLMYRRASWGQCRSTESPRIFGRSCIGLEGSGFETQHWELSFLRSTSRWLRSGFHPNEDEIGLSLRCPEEFVFKKSIISKQWKHRNDRSIMIFFYVETKSISILNQPSTGRLPEEAGC